MTNQPTPASIENKIEKLEAQRATLGNEVVDAGLAVLRQQLAELLPPPGGSIEAGRDISARDIITGVQHITQLYLETGGQWREADYRRALARYLAWLRDDVGQVVLRGILKRAGGEAVELPLDQVYVPLAAETQPEEDNRLQRQLQRLSPRQAETLLAEAGHAAAHNISMRQLLAQGPRLIVIGAPGCGKTTVLQHIAFTLCRALAANQPALAETELGLSGPLPLPIYVPLNRYADHRRRFTGHPDPRQRQLATFISHYLIERQAGLELPADFFAALVNQGHHLILLLDGLDEVPNETERALVSQAVTDLTHGRPHLRVVVTSRSRAYQGEAVLGGQFRLARVRPLDAGQVAELIHHAYRAIYPQPHHRAQREQLAADLIDGVTRLEADRAERLGESPESRLVTTPLMVRMLLIVHVNQRRLPDQRAELYAEVVDTLLTSAHHPDRSVAQALAKLGGDWKDRRDMLQYLAFQMHSRGPEAGRDIAEPALVTLLTGHLTERRQQMPELAAELVADFVQMSRQRESLLEERGGRYRFSHLSFQEFLAARYLIEIERNRSGMGGIVAFVSAEGRAGDSWWREVILLTVGYLNVTSPDAAVALIAALAGLGEESPALSALALSLAELAATTFLEWGGAEVTQQNLAALLAALLTDRTLTGIAPPLRAAAGRALARLGDPREGILTLPPKMTPVIEGKFLYGGKDEGDEKEERTTAPFRASVYPITNAQFELFMEAGGYDTQKWWSDAGRQWRSGKPRYNWQKMNQPDFWDDPDFNAPNQPVVGVTWYEAEAFCTWLSEYANMRMGEFANGEADKNLSLVTRHSSLVFRLPTEAEWERLARGQHGREYPWGNSWESGLCNTKESDIKRTSAVGIFPGGESPTGAHDCAGNVWEWCANWYDKEGNRRVLRGGSWDFDQDFARCAFRDHNYPHNSNDYGGFRVVSPILGSES